MALIDDVRACLRVTSDMTDAEIQMLIDAAKADMLRCGVIDELLVDATMNSLVRSAIVCYAKALYGYDNPEAERFMESYRMMLAGLLNSRSNEYLVPLIEGDEEVPAPETDGG